MSRKGRAPVRETLPDPKYGSVRVEKFINRMMLNGKKSVTTQIMYEALDKASQKTGQPALEIFDKAIKNVSPLVEVKTRRVGGANYQVPVEIRAERSEALAMRWIISAARARSGKSMSDSLALEFVDATNESGAAFKKKDDTHRMAEANKAFSNFRW